MDPGIALLLRLIEQGYDRKAPGGSVSIEAVVSGVACHGVYHAGQIQLMKRARKKRDGR